MAPQLKRPILLGGVGLATGLWLLESVSSLPMEGGFSFTGLLALSAGAWWLKQRAAAEIEPVPELRVPQIDRAMVEGAIAQAHTTLAQLEAELLPVQTPGAEATADPLLPQSNATGNATAEATATQAQAIQLATGERPTTDLPATNASAAKPPCQFPELAALQTRLAQLTTEIDRQELRFAVLGGQAVGKTTVANVLAQHWRPQGVRKIRFMDTLQLFSAEHSSAELGTSHGAALATPGWAVPQAVLEADLLLFVTAGDITETERRCVAWLKERVARLIVVVNKQDQHLPEQQVQLLAQVRKNLKELLPTGDVVAIAAQPAPIRVIRRSIASAAPAPSAPQASDSSSEPPAEQSFEEVQSLTQPDPDLSLLVDRLNQLLIAEPAQELTWATACHSANALAEETKTLLNQLRRKRASKVIDQYQWVAAGAAFINPVPTLDLLATGAVNSQLILDLSKIYRQPLSTDHAKTLATTLAEMLVKLGLVEVSSKMLGIALKTNGATYVAGGLIQGASAAYLTRTVGSSLVEYFEMLEVTGAVPQSQSMEQLRQIVQRVFTASRRAPALQSFAKQAIGKLVTEPIAEPATPITETVAQAPKTLA